MQLGVSIRGLIAPFLLTGPILVFVMGASPAVSQDISTLPAQLQSKVENAQSACAAIDDGEFALDWGAVERVDLDGDLYADWVLNEVGFACSSAASLYCGTGGCMSHFLVEDSLQSLLNKGWSLEVLGPFKVLLAQVHGSQCDGINPTPCVTASVWDDEAKRWRSTGAKFEKM